MEGVRCAALLCGVLLLAISPSEAGRHGAARAAAPVKGTKEKIAAMGLQGMQDFIKANNAGIGPETTSLPGFAPFVTSTAVPAPATVVPANAAQGGPVLAVAAVPAGVAQGAPALAGAAVPVLGAMGADALAGAAQAEAPTAQADKDEAEGDELEEDEREGKRSSFGYMMWIVCASILILVVCAAVYLGLHNKIFSGQFTEKVAQNEAQLSRLRMKAQKLSVKHGSMSNKIDTSKMVSVL
jgi:hypothetical protein